MNTDRCTAFFTARVIEHWKKYPRVAVESPSSEILKIHLDVPLSTLPVFLLWARGAGLMISKDPFPPQLLFRSWTIMINTLGIIGIFWTKRSTKVLAKGKFLINSPALRGSLLFFALLNGSAAVRLSLACSPWSRTLIIHPKRKKLGFELKALARQEVRGNAASQNLVVELLGELHQVYWPHCHPLVM